MFDHILAKSNGITLQQHLEDVAKIAVCVAQNVGLDPEIARMGAHLHDIGKASPIFQERLKQKNLPPCKTEKTKSTKLKNEKYRINKSKQQNEKYKEGAIF